MLLPQPESLLLLAVSPDWFGNLTINCGFNGAVLSETLAHWICIQSPIVILTDLTRLTLEKTPDVICSILKNCVVYPRAPQTVRELMHRMKPLRIPGGNVNKKIDLINTQNDPQPNKYSSTMDYWSRFNQNRRQILRPRDLPYATGLSRTTCWRLSKDPTSGFPKKLKLSTGAVGYFLEDIEAWLRTREVI